MEPINKSKRTSNSNGKEFSSNNLIPKNVRRLLQKKLRATKAIRKSSNTKRCVQLRQNIIDAEIELKTFYQNRKQNKEDIIFNKAKENKNNTKIGPFYDNGKIINDKPCNVLKTQYEKMFSKS